MYMHYIFKEVLMSKSKTNINVSPTSSLKVIYSNSRNINIKGRQKGKHLFKEALC